MLVIDRYSVRRDGKHWFGLAVWKWEGSLMTSVQVIGLERVRIQRSKAIHTSLPGLQLAGAGEGKSLRPIALMCQILCENSFPK